METPIGPKIAAAFVKAQRAFGPALKTSTNPHFKSKYADLSNCVEAVIEALNANGIGLMQRTYDSKDGVMVETVFVHESGEVMECGLLHVPASKQDPQGYGSALTYARRYSLLAATGLAPEDDDGNAAVAAKPTAKPFDITAVLDRIEACKTVAEIALIWGSETVAAQASGNGSYQALKAACVEKKAALTPKTEEVAA